MSPGRRSFLHERRRDEDSMAQVVRLQGGALDGQAVLIMGSRDIVCAIHQPDVQGLLEQQIAAARAAHAAGCAPYHRTHRMHEEQRVYEAHDTMGMPATELCRATLRIEDHQAGRAPRW